MAMRHPSRPHSVRCHRHGWSLGYIACVHVLEQGAAPVHFVPATPTFIGEADCGCVDQDAPEPRTKADMDELTKNLRTVCAHCAWRALGRASGTPPS